MTTSRVQVRKAQLSESELLSLMAYADGECTPSERAVAERLLLEKPDALRVVQATSSLSASVKSATLDAAHADVIDNVMKAIGKPVLRSIDGGAAAPSRTKRNLMWGTGIASTLALAAGMAFMVRSQNAAISTGVTSAISIGVEIQQVEAANPVYVFTLPAALDAKASSIVVWVSDDEETKPVPSGTASAPPASSKP
jgi:anti-sigma factor RsiW